MDRASRLPLGIVAAMLALVIVVTGNLTGIGIGDGPLLFDTIALPRLVIAVVLTLAAWTAWFAVSARTGEPLKVDIVWALLGGLVVWTAVSLAFSPHRDLGVLGQSERLEGVVTIALYALLYGIALQGVHRIGDVRLIASVIGAAAILVSVYGLAQYAGFEPFDYSFEGLTFEMRRAFATFGNPTFLAGLLVLALPSLGALAIRAENDWTRLIWAFGAILVAAALFATFSRGAWVAALLQATLGGVVLWRVRGTIPWSSLRVPMVVGVVVGVGLIVISMGAVGELNIGERINAAINQAGSVSERQLLAEAALSATLSKPLTGYGPDSFLPAFRLHRPNDYVIMAGAHMTSNNAHSWPLQFAATLGVPGVLLAVGAVVAALGRTGRSVLPLRRVRFMRPPRLGDEVGAPGDLYLAAAWLGCAGFAVHMLTGVAVLGSTVPFFVLLGALGAPLARGVSLRPVLSRGGVALAGAMTVVAIAASVMLIAADASYLASRKAFHSMAPGDPLALAQEARARNPLSVKYARGAGQAAAAQVESAIAAGSPPETVRALYNSAAEEFALAFRRNPNDYPGHAWFASLQARTGLYLEDAALLRDAQESARRAVEFDRHNEQVFLLANGDFSVMAINNASAVWPLP